VNIAYFMYENMCSRMLEHSERVIFCSNSPYLLFIGHAALFFRLKLKVEYLHYETKLKQRMVLT
jgi:hypothetical protein